MYGQYDEYHTSADNKEFMGIDHVCDSAQKIIKILDMFEGNKVYKRINPYGEPFLSKHNMYPAMNTHGVSHKPKQEYVKELVSLLNYCDGKASLSDVSQATGIDYSLLLNLSQLCVDKGLLYES